MAAGAAVAVNVGHGSGEREQSEAEEVVGKSGRRRPMAGDSGKGGGRVAAASSSGCSRGGRGRQQRGEEDGRMGVAVVEEGATAVDAGVAAAVWLKHECASTGWGCRRQMGAAAATTEARMRCDNRKRRRHYCAPTGKEWATAAKQRRQWGSSGSGEEWQAAANDGWQRRQVRSREEGEKQGRGGDRVGVCDRGLQAVVRRRLQRLQWEMAGMAGMAGGDEEEGRRNYGGRRQSFR
ncbi:hypothetical protein BHE74_00046039 [Ensete ventricosum]|nr:hypothetical protein BHE74_00046039 [Ensete ventricosum]